MASRFWVGGTGNWDGATTTHWSATSGGAGGASAPGTSDDATFDTLSNATGYTVTITAGAVGRNITVGGPLTGTATVASSGNITIAGGLNIAATGVSWTATNNLNFTSTATGNVITTNGATLGNVSFNGIGGGWTLGSALTSTGVITLTNGALSLGGFNTSSTTFSSSTSNTRALTFTGSETMTLTSTSTVWNVATSTGMTLTPASGTIKTTDASASQKTFSGGSLTYNKLWFSGIGTGVNNIVGSNTFATLQMDGTLGVKTLTLAQTSTTTITTAAGFQINGDGTHQTVFNSALAGTPAMLSIASGTVSLQNVSLKDSTATGGATFNALTSNGNIDNTGNTGWNFGASASVRQSGGVQFTGLWIL